MIYTVQVYNSMNFNIFTEMYNYQNHQTQSTFCYKLSNVSCNLLGAVPKEKN
jgi:hypothetical protein